MNCKQCNKELTGRQTLFCSDRCRKQYDRNADKSDKVMAIVERGQENADKPIKVAIDAEGGAVMTMPDGDSICVHPIIQPGSLRHYEVHPSMYATRTNPDLLNWGQHMNSDELKQAGLKANRVPIPGDYDYVGCCVKTEQGWAACG